MHCSRACLLSPAAHTNGVVSVDDLSAACVAALAFREPGHVECATVCAELGADLEGVFVGELTPLCLVARQGRPEALMWLLDRGADPNEPAADGTRPLEIACVMGRRAAVQALVARGANPLLKNAHGRSAVLAAAYCGDLRVAEAVFEVVPTLELVNERSLSGRGALHFCAWSGSAEVAALLVARGCDPGAVDERKTSPVHVAAHLGHEGVLAALLASPLFSARTVLAENSDGLSPLDLASNVCSPACVRMLLEKSSDEPEVPARAQQLHLSVQLNPGPAPDADVTETLRHLRLKSAVPTE